MLELTRPAVDAIRDLTRRRQHTDATKPAEETAGGVRLVSLQTGHSVLGVPVEEPEPGDLVISRHGATCFVDPDLAEALDDKQLQAPRHDPARHPDLGTTVTFALRPQPQPQ